MPTQNQSKTTRRALLGTAALGLSGYTGYAKMQDAEPDGQIITFPDCRTAIVEGANWSQIRFSKIYGPTQNGMGQTQPDDDGITRLSVEDRKKGYINWVRCYVERDGTRFLALERDHPNADECESDLPTTTTEVQRTTTPASQNETTEQIGGGFDLREDEIIFNGCESVTIDASYYTWVTVHYGSGENDGEETYRGEWGGRNTFGEEIEEPIEAVDVGIEPGVTGMAGTNPDNSCRGVTDDPREAAETTTTTEQVAEVREIETATTTTAEQTTRRGSKETTTHGDIVGRLIGYLFSL